MPLIQSPKKKALEKNIKIEMDAHPGKEHRAQNLAIAYSVQRKNKGKKKMAEGGAVLSKDQEPVNPKVNPKLGKEYEGDNEPNIHAGAKDHYSSPAMREYMASKSPKGSDTPKESDEHAIKKEKYLAANAVGYAHGGSIFGKKAEYDGVEHPHDLEEDNDQMRPASEDYEGNDWAGGKDLDGKDEGHNPSEEEYMANHMKMLAKGGHVACMACGGMGYAHGGEIDHDYADDEMPNEGSVAEKILSKHSFKKLAEGGEIDDPFDHGEGISHFQEEGPGVRQKYNMVARDYNQGDDRQISKQPTDSDEYGDEEELESEDHNDRVGSIRKKMKSERK